MKIIKYTAALLFVLFGTTSFAASDMGLMIEPFATYEGSSKTEFDWPAPLENSTGSSEGFGLGLRLGMHFHDVFYIAADGRYSKPQFKDTSNNMDVAATQYNYGLTAGVQTPYLGVRFWGSYVFGGELNPDEDNGADVLFKEAKGYRVGAGFHLSIVSVNLEYQDLKYDKANIVTAGVESELDNELTNKSFIFSVGFPFEF